MMWDDYRRFRGALLRAIDTRFYPASHLDMLVYSGIAQVMTEPDAAIVFEVKIYPSGLRDVHGLVAAGNMATIVEKLIPRAEQWGREHGCSGALIQSRPGWAKAMKSKGYKVDQVAIRKEL